MEHFRTSVHGFMKTGLALKLLRNLHTELYSAQRKTLELLRRNEAGKTNS